MPSVRPVTDQAPLDLKERAPCRCTHTGWDRALHTRSSLHEQRPLWR